ncbi:hypothetical protein BDQ17DRAFT_1179047, partial [Cyathus striatus]
PLPFPEGPLQGLLLDPKGIKTEINKTYLKLCKECYQKAKQNKLPPLALANHNYLGPVPERLKDLTVVEESMISCCCAHACIIQLHEFAQHLAVPTTQRGLKGHVIVFSQKPSQLAKVLPPLIDDVTSMICVLFVGLQPPSSDWLCLKAKPLVVHHDKVCQALLWLKHNNPFYSDIEINYDRLNNL